MMTPEERFDRIERILGLFISAGRRTREQWRERSREQDEKINIMIDTQIRDEAVWRAKSNAINEQLKAVAIAQAELTKSQKLTDRALRAFINSLHKGSNGKS